MAKPFRGIREGKAYRFKGPPPGSHRVSDRYDVYNPDPEKKANTSSVRESTGSQIRGFMKSKKADVKYSASWHVRPQGKTLDRPDTSKEPKKEPTIHEEKSRLSRIVKEAVKGKEEKKDEKKKDKKDKKDSDSAKRTESGEIKLSGDTEKFCEEPTITPINHMNGFGV